MHQEELRDPESEVPSDAPTLDAIDAVAQSLRDPPTWDSPTGRALVFRLLLVLPFPSSFADLPMPDGQTAVSDIIRLVGRMFELIRLPPRFLRHLSNMWIRWSYARLTAVADTRAGRVKGNGNTYTRGTPDCPRSVDPLRTAIPGTVVRIRPTFTCPPRPADLNSTIALHTEVHNGTATTRPSQHTNDYTGNLTRHGHDNGFKSPCTTAAPKAHMGETCRR